jgi:asparagine synthase (glutamine-hydrolysing)
VAERYGARHFIRRVSQREFENDLSAILVAMDQPSIDGVNTWFIAKAAHEAGLKVALSGVGGDELLGGYPSFRDVPRWHRRFGPLAVVPGLGWLTRSLMEVIAPEQTRTRPKMLGMLEYASTWAGAYLLRRGLFLPHELYKVIDPDLARKGLRRLSPMQRLAETLSPDPRENGGRVCALESSHYMRNQLLRDADWAGMAHSIEIRTPLVDTELLRSLAPVIGKLGPGMGKAALAKAPTLPLPAEVIRRAKTGFEVPTAAWMNTVARTVEFSASSQPETAGLASRQWSRVAFSSHLTSPRESRAT